MEIWKTAARADGKAIHNLMEKDKPFPTGLQTAFPQPHNPGSLHTFPQRLLLRIPSYPFLSVIKEGEAETKRAGVQPSDEPKSCTPVLYLWEVCEIKHFSLHIGKGIAAREIIKAPSGKADTGNHFAVFPPLSPRFLERLDM